MSAMRLSNGARKIQAENARARSTDRRRFGESREYIRGANFYPAHTRNFRVNFQVIDVKTSAVSSTFGFYVGGQTGRTYSAATSLLF